MDISNYYEIIGYIGSSLVAISLTMTSIIRLRIINLIGGSVFFIYAYLIGATPIMIVNVLIASINIYYLIQMKNNKEYFSVLEVDNDSQYWDAFLQFYEKEIQIQRPDFDSTLAHDGKICFFLLRDAVPAGIFQGYCNEKGELLVELDYVIPRYQDFKLGKFLFENRSEFFISRGISKILSKSMTAAHDSYLKKMHFNYDETDQLYFLNLT